MKRRGRGLNISKNFILGIKIGIGIGIGIDIDIGIVISFKLVRCYVKCY
jgi:hypothetical protein